MGTITDLTSLVTNLVDRIKDRKAAGDLREIQRMIVLLQSEQAKIHEDNIELRTQNAELKQKNEELQQDLIQAKQAKEPSASESDLAELETKILVLIANSPKKLSREMVANHFGLSKAKGDYYFDQLSNREFIRLSHVQRDGAFFRATSVGREYLASRDLLE